MFILFGSTSLLLGYLIERNESEQQAQQEQYRKFEIIQAVQQAINLFRHNGGELNKARLQKSPELEAQAQTALEQSHLEVDRQLDQLRHFDPASADISESALAQVTQYSQQVMDDMVAGKTPDPAILNELQRRLNLVETTLTAASKRERALAERIQLDARTRAALAIRIAIVMILATAIIGTVLVLLVVRSIIRPLRITTAAIRQVNDGQTEIDLPPISGDEFGQMALALRQFRDGAERLRRIAYLDPLTGLGNRAQLNESIEAALAAGTAEDRRATLLYLDLDNFRSINDRLGHKAGDAYLCEAATRLRRFLPDGTELCRYGGDKFIAILEDEGSAASTNLRLREVADCVLRGMAEPYRLGNHLLHMSVSIGVAVSPGDGATPEHLISSAEAAGHAAKRSGRNNARFAAGQLSGRLRRETVLAGEIQRGLEQREFEVFYQPIVDVALRRVVGAEALVRWHHPERGLLLPGEFIEVAENEGLINAIGERCLRIAHRQLRQWRESGLVLRVAVNLSARQVQDGKILNVLRGLRDEDAEATSMIDLELTESVLFDNSDSTRKTLDEIKRCGYRLGMDDFGTGYSSFSYLRRLPIDKIKIDRQFVADMSTSRQAEAIVSAMLALALKLELEVVAEGVETPLQQRLLLGGGCRLQQGYLFSTALPAGEFALWVAGYSQEQAQLSV